MDSMRKLRDRFRTTKLPADVDNGMETLEEYRSRWTSVRIIYYTMFLMSLGFTIVITGIWPYLSKLDPTASKEFMGLVVAANPLGQMLFSPLFGWWSNKLGTIRLPLVSSLCLFAIGSAMYSLLELQPANVKYWMIASRFLIGVSSANVAVCRSYISAATRLSERTHAVSMISLAQVLGFIIGPVMQALVTPLGEDGVSWLGGALVMNTYTTCGWINVVMVLGNLLLFLPAMFKEHKISAKEVMIMQGKSSERETWKAIKPDYISAWTLIMSFFVLLFNFVLLETLGTVLIMDQFACTSNEAVYYMAVLMSAGAAVAFITFLTIGPLSKLIAERYLLIVGGFGLMGVGCLLFIPWGDAPPKLAEVYNVTIPVERINGTLSIDRDDPIFLGCPKTQAWCETTPAMTATQFTLGYGLVSVGYPIGVTLIQTIFSKILGPRPQGVWMGLMTGSGCLSRILGPVFVGSIYTRLGTYYTFGVTALMMVLTSFWLLLSNKRLLPPAVETAPAVELEELNVQSLESSNDALDSKLDLAEPPAPENEKLIAQRNNAIITKSFNT